MEKLLFALAFLQLGLCSCSSQTESKSEDFGYTSLDVAAFKSKMSEPNTVLLDVRTPEETAQGMIDASAMQLDYEAASFESEVVKLDKSKVYLVYCRSGKRSSGACEYMAGQGFTKLYNLEGGYNAWTGNE